MQNQTNLDKLLNFFWPMFHRKMVRLKVVKKSNILQKGQVKIDGFDTDVTCKRKCQEGQSF